MRAKIANLANIHETMAAGICKDGPRTLVCMTCGKKTEVDQETVANCLRMGWPKCDGATMELI
jgi:hypothetical protein